MNKQSIIDRFTAAQPLAEQFVINSLRIAEISEQKNQIRREWHAIKAGSVEELNDALEKQEASDAAYVALDTEQTALEAWVKEQDSYDPAVLLVLLTGHLHDGPGPERTDSQPNITIVTADGKYRVYTDEDRLLMKPTEEQPRLPYEPSSSDFAISQALINHARELCLRHFQHVDEDRVISLAQMLAITRLTSAVDSVAQTIAGGY